MSFFGSIARFAVDPFHMFTHNRRHHHNNNGYGYNQGSIFAGYNGFAGNPFAPGRYGFYGQMGPRGFGQEAYSRSVSNIWIDSNRDGRMDQGDLFGTQVTNTAMYRTGYGRGRRPNSIWNGR